MDTTRNCERCNGKGKTADILDKAKQIACYKCEGVGTFQAPDEQAIRAEILATRGKNKGKLKASLASNKASARAYYVWRMARFHGGADVTLPIMAGMLTGADPFREELDALADVVARESFGTDMMAAKRWGRALGYLG